MVKKLRPAFFPALLAICLLIGTVVNLLKGKAPFTSITVLIVSGLVLLASYWLAPMLNRLSTTQVRWLIGIGLVVMVTGQILIVTFLPVTVYHDAYRVLSQADKMAAGKDTWNITYFWRYPNNVPLAYFLSLWFRLTNLVHLSTNVAVHILSLLALDGFIGLLLNTIHRITPRRSVLLGALAFMVLTPFAYTYFLQVFYSDLPAMIVLLVIFRTLTFWSSKTRRQRILAGIGLCLTVLIGQLLRPNLIVLIPAIIVIGVLVMLKKGWRTVRLSVPMLLILLGFALSVPANQGIRKVSNFEPHAAFALPVTSWILMGTNTQSQGMYSGSDIGHEIKLSSTARQTYDVDTIVTRIKKLGPVGIVKLWLDKLSILLDVRSIQTWGDGGYRAAPSWYQQHAAFFETLVALSYQIVTDVLLLLVAWRLLAWRPRIDQPADAVLMLTIVTALGYLAFHTLLWEVEERYGQAILPLLFYQLAALPVVTVTERRRQPLTMVLSAVAAGCILLGLAPVIDSHSTQTIVVAAQRSQLSAQYHAKPAKVNPGTVLTERVDLNHTASYFSVQIHLKSQVQVTLENLSDHRIYLLQYHGDVYRWIHSLPQGQYDIVVKNTSSIPQRVDVVRTQHYQLAYYPLIINGHVHTDDSFVYTALATK
ncbi:MAG: hypothetical protein ABF743_11755 [Schleiferilactobacillus perolens]|uniref:hypothetical protein n=1 Tax=Schleiferilactobacillus perolens TaxID=100468 RepID=UPI0039EB3BDA